MKLTILGSGTSTGVPLVGCLCQVCTSENSKDRRRRASILVQNHDDNILIDTGPDLREQMLTENIQSLCCVLYTHYHYDHMGGLNDLRPFCFHRDEPLSCFCNTQTRDEIKRLYPYVFTKEISGQVDLDIKTYRMNHEQLYSGFQVGGFLVQPVRLMHVPQIAMESVGFVFNKKVGYLTDFKFILPEYEIFLYDLEILILGSPVYKQHPTHISIPDAFNLFERYKPRRGIIAHLGHEFLHDELVKKFPKNVSPAYDRMFFEFE